MSGAESLVGALLQATPDDALESGRNLALRPRQLSGLVLQDRVQGLHRGAPLESATATQHLVEDGAEGEDVGACVRRLTAHLLGGHVADRPQNRTWIGPLRDGRGLGVHVR